MMKKWMLILVALLSLGLLAGCGNRMQTVEIEVKNMVYSKKEIALKTGVPVKLVLINKDTEIHDLSVDEIHITSGTSSEKDDHDHDGNEPDLHVSAKPGEKGTIIFTPVEDGVYTFYCTVTNHREHGMEGTLYVSASGKLPKK